MKEVVIDALLDSLKIFAVVVVFQYVIALIEPKLSEKISFKGKLAPLIGVSISLLPQCGFSVVATDLYQKDTSPSARLLAYILQRATRLCLSFWARRKSVARATANCAEICFGTCFRIYDRSYTFKKQKESRTSRCALQ